MATTQYTGARYVPVFADPAEWNNTRTYEPLTIVMHEGNSYTSAQYVPLGVDISNEKFWKLTGNYNSQVEQYRQDVERYATQVNTVSASLNAEIKRAEAAESALQTDINNALTYVTPEMFGAVGDGSTDDSDAIQKALDSGKPVIFSLKAYMVKKQLTINNKTVLRGSAVGTYTVSNIDYTKATLITDIDDDVIIGSSIGKVYGISFMNKNSNKHYLFATRRVDLRMHDCEVVNYVALANYGTLHLTNCHIERCTKGVYGIIDSHIQGCVFNANKTGIDLAHGSYANVINNNTFEWNTSTGISSYISGDNTITSNFFDRNGVAIDSRGGSQMVIIGNTFRRNGFEGSYNVHIHMESTHFSMCGNAFLQGNSKDDGSGEVVPAKPFQIQGSYSDNVFSANYISGNEKAAIGVPTVSIAASVCNKLDMTNGGQKLVVRGSAGTTDDTAIKFSINAFKNNCLIPVKLLYQTDTSNIRSVLTGDIKVWGPNWINTPSDDVLQISASFDTEDTDKLNISITSKNEYKANVYGFIN